MVEGSSTEEGGDRQGDGRVRFVRRRFLGGSLAAAGAALLPSAGGARAEAAPAAEERAPSAGSIPQLPLRSLYPNLPAVPVDLAGMLDTLLKLAIRAEQTEQSKQGLTQKLEIGGVTQRAYAFLFTGVTPAHQTDEWQALKTTLQENPEQVPGQMQQNLDQRTDAPGAVQPLSLDRPNQFSISWTSFPNVYGPALQRLPDWADTLTDADAATRSFWPMIARFGYGYNLIIPERVTRARAKELKQQFGGAWSRGVRRALADGDLYVIDMSRFEALQPQSVNGAVRFTPATITLLIRNRRTKLLNPVAIIVSGHNGGDRTVYDRGSATNGAWLYALQAAKTSITVYGVWLGHVYHWHIVTAAMQMTMLNTLPTSHPIYQLLAPQSKYAIPFDDVLLVLWSQIAPPTSLTAATDFLALTNEFAKDRLFFDDDPRVTIDQLGLPRKDFSKNRAWDRYPVVDRLLEIWDLVDAYTETFVATTYSSDGAVAGDDDLQRWIATASSTDSRSGGNIRGLPAMNSRAELQRLLTSLLYRITAHGISRLSSTSNPALTFVANFPHCLQRTDIPSPRARIGTKELLGYLPNTDTISQAVTFYFTFAFSTPYEPFIPLGGENANLFFPGGEADSRNQALIELRDGLSKFINDYQPKVNQRFQWPLNIET